MISLKQIDAFRRIHPTRPAIIAGDKSLSWQDLHIQTMHRVAYLQARRGGELPSQACYVADNRLDLIPWLAAFSSLGIPAVGLDYTLPFATVQAMAERIDADFVLISSKRLGIECDVPVIGRSQAADGTLLDLDSLGVAYVDAIGASLYEEHGLRDNPARPFRAVGFTSGTSGLPKAVLRSRSFDQRRFQYFAERYGFGAGDRFLVSMPLYHAAGNGWARLFLALGATLYLGDGADSADLSWQMSEYGITATVLSPVLLAGLLKARRGMAALPALRWVLVGGRNFTAIEKQRALQMLGPVIYEYYGTTESGVNTIAEPADLAAYPASVGRAYDGNTIAVLGADGRPVDVGQVGTVCIASYMNMDDYLGGGGEFAQLDGERYFVTPDMGYLDEEGRLYLLNRAGGGANQAPLYRLENALRELPCIEDVALLQKEDTVSCAFKIRPDRQDSERLRQRIAEAANDENVSLFGCRPLAEIPYSPSGKVRVKDLERVLEAG
ncbi:class I adenylate-forming enzyme family protein [Chromobacterium alticapitis]|uniref:Long-chain fatty acid--CoA ligase n=1 Tax=Chromobacterium alticapitis TaxID=2073169 RepID=A0A2S5DJG1_9NEIS|nr:AMP-binding protein [Chromobacterium alticapitis]POZ63230.1 long-chain fatty acid--CoA ligase [Chromobacterium alticapitis]